MGTAVEVVSDHRKRFFASGGTVFDPSLHVLIECDWLRTARRDTNRPDLLMYWHKRTRCFIVGVWATRPDSMGRGGCMIELEDMHEHPDRWMKARERALSLSFLRVRLRPVGDQLKEMDRKAKAEWDQEVHLNDCTNRQQKELEKHLDRKGAKYQHLRALLQRGEAEYVGDDEGGAPLKALREGLLNLL